MKIHVIGAGPTGLAVAWELAGDHNVTVHDKKPSAGGSWWEPEKGPRDLHAHRIVFDRAWVNTRSMFDEMGMNWHDYFEPVQSKIYTILLKAFSWKDYWILASTGFRVLMLPTAYENVTVKDVFEGLLSSEGEKVLKHITLIMDGVTWDVMTAYEFVTSFNQVAFSTQCTQKVSGRAMCDAMQSAASARGVNFQFNSELLEIDHTTGHMKLSGDREVKDAELVILCLDNSPAMKFLGTNWGVNSEMKLRESTYGAINVLLDFEDGAPEIEEDLSIAMRTPWKLQPKVLADGKTISCVICNLTEDILTAPPEALKKEVLRQLRVGKKPTGVRIGWGASWSDDENRWSFTQSSGVLSRHGQLPFFGASQKVAMCGMMSPRRTPYSSMEAAVEVGRAFCSERFGTRAPMRPLTVVHIFIALLIGIALLLITPRT